MKKNWAITLILATIVLLMGCQSLPEPVSNNDTLLVIETDFEFRGTDRKPFRYYILILEESDEIIKIMPTSELLIIDYLEPGSYSIVEVESHHMEAFRIKKSSVDIQFTMSPGKITILNNRFSMWIQPEERDGSSYYQYWFFEKLTRSEIEEIALEISNMKNYELWDQVIF